MPFTRNGHRFQGNVSQKSTTNASFIGFTTIEKWNTSLKNMMAGMVAWYGLTVPWKKIEKVWLMTTCTPFINWTITEEVSWFRGGNHQDWRGIQISILVCHWFFFDNEHTPSNATCSNLAFFRAHLPYLGDYVTFLGIIAHNSNSNNRCMKRCKNGLENHDHGI